jgi:hypothetical protein
MVGYRVPCRQPYQGMAVLVQVVVVVPMAGGAVRYNSVGSGRSCSGVVLVRGVGGRTAQ